MPMVREREDIASRQQDEMARLYALRQEIERTIQRMIDLLDAIDAPAEDLEDDEREGGSTIFHHWCGAITVLDPDLEDDPGEMGIGDMGGLAEQCGGAL